MKNSTKLSFFVIMTIVATLFSCSSDADDALQETNTLVGEWQRLDATTSFENTFVFYADNSGTKIFSEAHADGTAISNAVTLEWHASNNNLLLILNEEINTPYSFNAEGQLILSAISEIPFVRID